MIITKKTISKQSELNIETAEGFIAIITEHFVTDEKCLEECRVAEELNKPMYAIIKDKKAWETVKDKFNWRKSLPVSEQATKTIKEDLQMIKGVNEFAGNKLLEMS